MTSSTPGSSTADLLQAISSDLSSLVRQELRSAQTELADMAKQAGKGGALLGGAAVLGVAALGTSTAFVVRLLDRRFSPTTSALLATALFGGGAAALGSAALQELRKAGPLLPEQTVASIRQDVRAAAGTTDSASGPTTAAGGTTDGSVGI